MNEEYDEGDDNDVLADGIHFSTRASEDIKWVGVAHYYFYGTPYREIGKMLFRNHTTVMRWWSNFVKYVA